MANARSGKKNGQSGEADLQNVARKLLELYASLEAERAEAEKTEEQELTSRVSLRMREQ